MIQRRRSDGLTLIEVVIAIAVLAIGVLAAFAMQVSALQGTRAATINQEMSNIAQSELELQRAFARTISGPGAGLTCRTAFEQPAYTCSVTVRACSFTAGALACGGSVTGTPAAWQITVSVQGPQGRQLQVSTVAR